MEGGRAEGGKGGGEGGMFSHGTERIACKVKSQYMRRLTSILVKMPDYNLYSPWFSARI